MPWPLVLITIRMQRSGLRKMASLPAAHRKVAPSALVVAPSIADGGPGLFGFEKSVLPWLQAFLLHTHAKVG
jgi:hypothetical protein